MKKYILMSLAAIVMLVSSCSKTYLDTVPTGSVGSVIAFENVENLDKALSGAYLYFATWYGGDNGRRGFTSMHIKYDLISGLMVRPAKSTGWFYAVYQATIWEGNTSTYFSYDYRYMYLIIKSVNAIITYGEELSVSENDEGRKAHIIAEAKAMRAYCYYHLAISYALRPKEGHDNSQPCVPLVTDPTDAAPKPRNTLAEIITQINKDLTEAETTFKNSTFTPSYQKGKAEKFGLDAVKMVKARVAMYTRDYATALSYAKEVADDYDIMGVEAYYEGFNDLTNKEWILGVMITAVNPNYFGSYYAYMGCNYNSGFVRGGAMCMDTRYLNRIPTTDRRIVEEDGSIGLYMTGTQDEVNANGKTYYYNEGFLPTATSTAIYSGMSRKYKTTAPESTTGDGDIPYIRAAEAYYIVAEAAALTGDLATAQQYLEGAVQPYDPTFEAAADIDGVLDQTVLYKLFDMYGEGRSYEDFKRRGTLVDRTGSNHPEACLVYQYGPKEDQPRNDIFTYIITKGICDDNGLLDPVNKY